MLTVCIWSLANLRCQEVLSKNVNVKVARNLEIIYREDYESTFNLKFVHCITLEINVYHQITLSTDTFVQNSLQRFLKFSTYLALILLVCNSGWSQLRHFLALTIAFPYLPVSFGQAHTSISTS